MLNKVMLIALMISFVLTSCGGDNKTDVGVIHTSLQDTNSEDEPDEIEEGDSLEVVLPPVTTNFDLELVDLGGEDCKKPLPGGSGAAVLRGSDDGFVAQLNNPLGLGVRGDGEGGLIPVFNGPTTAGFGETAPKQLEVDELRREAETFTVPVAETIFTEDFPDGCTRSYTLEYTLEDGTVLDFLGEVPYGNAEGVDVENPNLEYGGGFYTIEGQFTSRSGGHFYGIFTEMSGSDHTYDLTQIFPEPDGSFSARIDVDPPADTWMIFEILFDGVPLVSTSGNAKSD
jgi:hypothetical protein